MDILIIPALILVGVLTGIVTGLLPGIHVNTIAAIMVSISAMLYTLGIDSTGIAVFIASVAVTHAFFDYIPSLFLGVPNDEVFALLPGHRMVKSGEGMVALHLSIKGSWLGIKVGVFVLVIALGLSLTGIDIFGGLDTMIRPALFWILLIISIILIMSEKRKVWALTIFMLSGLFGIIVLGSPLIPNSNNAFNGLFPALVGIFGVSGLIFALFEKTSILPEQKEVSSLPVENKEIHKSALRGTGAGMAVGLLPGLGAANAATLLFLYEKLVNKKKKQGSTEHSYIVTTSAINTADTLFGIAALYFIEKTRSGASVAMSQLFGGSFSLYALTMVIASMFIAAFLSMKIMQRYSRHIAHFLSKLHYKSLNFAILIFLSIFVYLTLREWGIVILAGGALLGMLPPLLDVRRAQAMGFFLLPVLLFYSGHQGAIVSILHLEAKLRYYENLTISTLGVYLLISLGIAGVVYLIGILIKRFRFS